MSTHPIYRHLLSVVIMLIAGSLVFSVVGLMNRGVVKQEETLSATIVDFTVDTRSKAPERRSEPQQRQAGPSEEPALAPLPDLGAGASSIQVEMPVYEFGSVGSADSLLGDLENVVMSDESVDVKPAAIEVEVPYPSRARQRKLEGVVVVSVLIGTDGRVRNAKILESQPPGVFDQAVLDAVPGWRFVPARYKNQDVSIWATVPLDFSLR